MPKLVLYDYFRSSAAFRVRIALNLKGLAYERVFFHLLRDEHRDPAYLARNPQGLVPALKVDGTLLTQSLAIIDYLEELVPEPALLPKDPFARAWVRSLALAVACEIHPLNNLRTTNYLANELKLDQPTRDQWYAHWIAEGLGPIEAKLATRDGTHRFCWGDRPTLADCCLIPQVFNARRFHCDTQPYPLIMGIWERAMAEPAFAAADPAIQPDAE